MANYYVKATGSNAWPFNSPTTAAPTLNDLFNGLSGHSTVLVPADIVYVQGVITEPANSIQFLFGGAQLVGSDSRIDEIYLADNWIEYCDLVTRLHIWTNSDSNSLILLNCREVSYCRIGFVGVDGQFTSLYINGNHTHYVNCKLYNNLFYNNGGEYVDVVISTDDPPLVNVDYVIVENNTFVNLTGLTITIRGTGKTADKVYIRNNVITINTNTDSYGIDFDNDLAVEIADFQHVYNVLLPYGSAPTYNYQNHFVPVPKDVTELEIDPLYIGSGSEPYALQTLSPARHTGFHFTDSPTDDLLIASRPNPPNRGAYEDLVSVVADFSGTPTSGYASLSVDFTDLSTGGPTGWDWDFGDFTPHSSLQNPTHVYTIPGSYTVTLIASLGASTFTVIKTSYVIVSVPPIGIGITVGAFEYIPGSYSGDLFVEGTGDDYRHFGGKEDPFRTLDKALFVADATTHIDGGHYDTYYLQMHNQYLDLNQLFIFTPKIKHLVSYKTMLPDNIKEGYYYLPGFLTNPEDSSNVAVNVVGGPTQVYGQDYKVGAGAVVWKGMRLGDASTGLVVGDTLRIMYGGQLQYKALNSLTFHSHYSNIEKERAIFVSPGGSDSTVLGGDGTNTGGVGSFDLPYRTIDKALSVSVPGSNIVAIAGEYPIFQPINDRILITAIDQTVVTNGQQYLEDDFYPNDFRSFGTTVTGPIPWNFTYTGDSQVRSGGGFLSLTYDGSNAARADSTFQIVNDFDVQMDLRAFVDPLKVLITSPDNTMFVTYSDQTYTCGAMTGGKTTYCFGVVDSTFMPGSTFITDYVSVTYENILNKSIPLGFLPTDCSNVALNIVGGTAQNFGEDFIIENGNLTWDSSSSLVDLDAGEVLRIMYELGNNSFAPIRVDMSLKGQRFTTRVFEQGTWKTAFRRDMVGTYVGPWAVSFVMDSTGANRLDCLIGRGFVSGFVAVANSIENSDIARPYGNITERKNLVLFADKALGFVTNSSLRTGHDGTRYRNRIDATGGTSDWAWPYTWSWQVTDGVVPPGVLFYDKQSYAWFDGTPTTPGDYTFTVQLNDPGSRDQSVSKDFFLTVE